MQTPRLLPCLRQAPPDAAGELIVVWLPILPVPVGVGAAATWHLHGQKILVGAEQSVGRDKESEHKVAAMGMLQWLALVRGGKEPMR